MHTRQRDMSSAVAGKPTTTIAMWRCRRQDKRPGQAQHKHVSAMQLRKTEAGA
jgi:hypothetical protein